MTLSSCVTALNLSFLICEMGALPTVGLCACKACSLGLGIQVACPGPYVITREVGGGTELTPALRGLMGGGSGGVGLFWKTVGSVLDILCLNCW